jgi:acetyl-CoA carboxylase biotin carboxyl carrier protein
MVRKRPRAVYFIPRLVEHSLFNPARLFCWLDLIHKTALPKRLTRPPILAVDLKDIKAIIDLMKKNDLSVFELEKDGFKLKLQKGTNGQPILTTPIALAPAVGPAAGMQAPVEAAAGPEKKEAGHLRDIVSPMVGTFYRASAPDAPAFVDIGQQVNEDTVVGIIEAMKVMNEIKAETSGIIAEVVAENGKPVQFGQVLFRIR